MIFSDRVPQGTGPLSRAVLQRIHKAHLAHDKAEGTSIPSSGGGGGGRIWAAGIPPDGGAFSEATAGWNRRGGVVPGGCPACVLPY